MPEVFQYLLKLSISLTVLYLFYFFVLRRLTFYNYNRWYLLGYSILSFFIAAINIAPLVPTNAANTFTWIQHLPTIQQLSPTAATANTTETIVNNNWHLWDYVALIFIAGVIFLCIRLLVQVISFNKVRRKASRIPTNGINVYQVNAPIIPFSFGKSIYLNSHLHAPQELEKIIQHEFVHVKQKHSIDIICSEIICFINWYNPFAWLIRKAIRQNLEYIADNHVIQNGINKKEYQYLLLKVIGNQKFSIAAPFNFSSLKKRIAMMNKLRTSKVHVLKFLFLLPLMATVLLAFRSEISNNNNSVLPFTYGGIIMDNKTGKPIANAKVLEQNSGASITTDKNGFFSFKVEDVKIDHKLSINGSTTPVQFTYTRNNEETKSFLVLVKTKQNGATLQIASSSIAMEWDGTMEEAINRGKTYAEQPYIKPVVESFGNDNIRLEAKGGVMGWAGTKPHKDMFITADTIKVIIDNPKEYIIYADKMYTGKEYNDKFNDVHVTTVYFFSNENAIKIWGNKGKDGVIMINDNPSYNKYTTVENFNAKDTVPNQKKSQIQKKYDEVVDTLVWVTDGRAKHDDFMERHPDVENINWTTKQRNAKTKADECFIKLTLKNGTTEKYNLLNDKDVQRFKDKYGELPVQAPPPPTPPTPVPISFSSKIPAHEYAVPPAPAYLSPKVATVPAVPPAPPTPSTNRTSKLSPAVQQSLDVYAAYNVPRNTNKPLSNYSTVTVQEQFVVRHRNESEKSSAPTPITVRKAVVRNTEKN